MIPRSLASARSCQARGGFNLLEMLSIVTIIGILALVILPRMATNSVIAKKNCCYTKKANIEIQTQLWYRTKGAWPATNFSDLGADTTFFPDGFPTCPVDGSAYTLDTTTHHVSGHTH
jgi:competence protein ComGC